MEKIKCIIIDDEPIAIEYLKQYVQETSELELIGTYLNPLDALPQIKNQSIDLLFLDIQMPQITGIELAKQLSPHISIIFTTAYPQYAVDGFNLNAADYLVKPIGIERFKQAINKVRTKLFVQETLQQYPPQKFIFLKNGYKAEKIDIQQITHIIGNKEYVTFHTSSGKEYLKNERLKNLEQEYNIYGFIRIHKSYLINKQYIKKIFNNTIEIEGFQLPIGRAYREQIRQLLHQ